MEHEIIGALIAAGASLGLAVFGLITNNFTKRSLLILEEQSKKSEQIRLKATESGEILIQHLTDVIISLETVMFHKKFTSEEEIVNSLKDLNKALSNLYRKNYESAIYTTPHIKNKIFETINPLLHNDFELNIDNLEVSIEKLISLHTEVAKLFNITYLGTPLNVI